MEAPSSISHKEAAPKSEKNHNERLCSENGDEMKCLMCLNGKELGV